MTEGAKEGTYFKEKSFEFALANLDEYEEKTIWASYDNRSEDIKDSKGNTLAFPIREGVLFDNGGKERKFEDLIKMPMPIFKALFPKLSIKRTTLRQVIVEGVEVYYNFSKTANSRLKEAIEGAKNMGTDPLRVIYKQTFDKSAQPAEMYKVTIQGKIDAAQLAPQTPMTQEAPQVNLNLNVEIPKTFEMNELESRVMAALLKLEQKIIADQFNKVCVDNGISDGVRIQKLFQYYEENKK